MKFTWIIQDSGGNHYNWTELYESVAACGSNAVYVPLGEVEVYCLNEGSYPIVIGGEDYLQLAIRNKNLCRGIFRDDSFFCVDNYIKIWGKDYLNSDAEMLPLAEISSFKTPFFVRPVRDDKSIDGQVVHSEKQALDLIRSFESDKNTLVCVAAVKPIHREWRAVIVNGKIVSVCRYAIDSKTAVSNGDVSRDLYEFIQKHCSIDAAPIVWVMDIAECRNEFYVLECNIFNASNFYDNDRQMIVYEVEKSINMRE